MQKSYDSIVRLTDEQVAELFYLLTEENKNKVRQYANKLKQKQEENAR